MHTQTHTHAGAQAFEETYEITLYETGVCDRQRHPGYPNGKYPTANVHISVSNTLPRHQRTMARSNSGMYGGLNESTRRHTKSQD